MFGIQDSNNQDSAAALFGSTPPVSPPPADPSIAPNAPVGEPPAAVAMPAVSGAPAVPESVEADEVEKTAAALSGGTIIGHPGGMASSSSAPAAMAVTDDLASIKQQALQKLSPLLEHLEQTPEEKFKTTMMMLQATDDHSLVPQVYAAANAISDEKIRAQALLDVVNEINYFTHKDQAEPEN